VCGAYTAETRTATMKAPLVRVSPISLGGPFLRISGESKILDSECRVQNINLTPVHESSFEGSLADLVEADGESRCSVAEATRVLGDRWAILIMREAFYGRTRFDEFEKLTGMAPNILSSRLKSLVGYDVLERKPCSTGKRKIYQLTAKGRAFFPVYVALKSWSDEWSGSDDSTRLCDVKTGRPIRSAPLLRADGSEICCEDVVVCGER